MHVKMPIEKNTFENHCFEKLIRQLPIDSYLALEMQGSFYLFIYDSGIGIAWKFNCFNGNFRMTGLSNNSLLLTAFLSLFIYTVSHCSRNQAR